MPITKIKKGDTVVVVSGKDRGKNAAVLRVFPKDQKILVEGVGLKKKHQKARRSGQKGEVISMPTRIHISNAMIYCSHCGKGVRVGYQISSDGTKQRVCRTCNNTI